MVPHEKVGLVCNPTSQTIADAIIRYYELGEDYFHSALVEEKKKYNWERMINTIQELAKK